MPRIQIDLPDRFAFSTEMSIYISHVNQGGHLDNAQLLSLESEARARFFQAQSNREAEVGCLATVVGAHEILVMEAGRIIERGTHAQLLAMDGRYAQMWSLQQQSTADQ